MINIGDLWEEERDMAWFRRACNGISLTGRSWEDTFMKELSTWI